MMDELPIHPTTGLVALGLRRNGAPIWPVLGGDGTGDGGTGPDSGDADASDSPDGDDQDADAGDDQDGGDGDGDPDGSDALGDPGKKALDSMKARLKRERDRRRQYEAELEQLRKGAERDETDADVVRREAERTATAKANQRIVRAEIRAAAAGKLADPADALSFLDLSAIEVDDDGNVDADEITDAIADLVQRKPYLAAQPPKRFQGGADGGQGRGAKPKDLDTQIREAEAKGDIQTAITLKQRKLAEASKKTK